MGKQKIQRVDLLKDGKAVKLTFAQSLVGKGGSLVESDNVQTRHKEPHNDLVNYFTKLVPHLVYLCELSKIESTRPEWFEDYKFLDEDAFNGFNVTGVLLSGKDMDMVKLIGTKTTTKKQVISILSPVVWLDDTSENKYLLLDILKTCVTKLMNEADLYLGGKYAPEAQGELELV